MSGKLQAVPFTTSGEISPDAAQSFTNLGFEVTQDHLDRAASLYVDIAEQNYYDDLFHALQVADQDIEDEL